MILANPKIELALVATCLANGPDTVRQAEMEVAESDFNELPCRNAWRVLESLVHDGGTVDEVGFETRWSKVINGATKPPIEIYEAVAKSRTASDVSDLVAELKDWSRRRKIHQYAVRLAEQASNPKVDMEAAWAECQTALRPPVASGHNEVCSKKAIEIHTADLELRHQLQGKHTGICTGLNDLDTCTDGLQKGEMSVFGARPSHGKSALLLQFAHHAAFKLNRPTLFISLEMSIAMLMRRLNAMETGISLSAMKRGALTEADFAKIAGFNSRMLHAPLWFYNGSTGMTITKVRSLVKQHIDEHGVELVVLDYLQRLHGSEKHEKRTYEVGEVSSGLQGIALENNIHVCTAAQLNREPDKAQGKQQGRMPKICDLADSAQIDRDGDLICLLQRKDMGDEANLIVSKQRDGEYAVQHLWFDKDHCRFTQQL